MKMRFNLFMLVGIILVMPGVLKSQNNVGIGTTNPNEKLEVSGIIYTNAGGVRFPDMTLQETAAFNEFGPEDASSPNGHVYLTITTANPPILDTIWLFGISQGGVDGTGTSGQTMPVSFRMTKEMDTTSLALFQKSVQNAVLINARIHFTTSTGFHYQTIEFENAFIEDIRYMLVYRGNGVYAHLEEIEIGGYPRMEFWRFGPGADPCFCWDFVSAGTCMCD